MDRKNRNQLSSGILIVFSVVLAAVFAVASAEEVPFSAERWDLRGAKAVEHLGRTALMGTAFLKETAFSDGVIEVDVAVTGARSYPGIIFRMKDPENYERVYIRPHRAGRLPPPLYPDVLQYVPAFNGIDSWQLYNGDSATAGAFIPSDQWFHVRLEVKGTQARVIIGDSSSPNLIIHELKHGSGAGGIGLMGPIDGSAYFSNFSVRADESLSFDPPPRREASPGVIRDWQVSPPFRALALDLEKTPVEQGLEGLKWTKVTADDSGLVDISRLYSRTNEPDCIFARTVIESKRDHALKLNLGYSDFVSVFLNEQLLFTADSSYVSRDPSFLGIIGYFDTVALPLKKGENQLLLAVAESSGGWGFMARDGEAVFKDEQIEKLWETPKEFKIPESAAFDPVSGAVYVSNYDAYNRSGAEGRQFISKLSPDGRVDKLKWAEGLRNPTGLVVSKGRLFAVEPTAIVEIDIAGARILERYDVQGAMMLNDVAAAADGALFISDSRKNVIFRFAGGQFEEWLKGPEVSRPNGVWVEGERLFWGNNGDRYLKSADLATKEVRVIARLGQGILDGVVGDGRGDILISHNEGRLYRVTPAGEVTKLIDTTVIGIPIADFTLVLQKGLIIIPAFTGNRVTAWRLNLKK